MIYWLIEILIFISVVYTILYKKRNFNLSQIVSAILAGLLISISFFYLFYLYMVPLNWIENFPILDLIFPILWVMLTIISWVKGFGPLQRYFPGVMFLLSPLYLYLLTILKWQWSSIRWVIFGMFFLSLMIHTVPKINNR